MRHLSFKEQVHAALNNERSRWFFPVNNILALIIVASTMVVILETVPELFVRWGDFFIYAEYTVLTIFGIEYLLRLWSAPNRLRYVTSFYGLIDLVSIVPSVFILLTPDAIAYHTLGIVRILRVLRLLRTLRLVQLVIPKQQRDRLSKELHNGQSLINFEIYVFALATVVILSATLMYVIEGHIPGTHIPSIPHGMWWAIVTISTVGYGDFVPITAAGRVVASLTMLAGLGLFVLMLTVVGHIMQIILFGSKLDKS